MTELLDTNTPELFAAAVRRASELLRAGELVALPTETVYGLAANAFDAAAVARIFEAKGRPSNNPIIVHVADLDMARQCVARWPKMADRLARAFWPGPLTLVLERAPVIPDIVTAGGQTVGVRWPSHPFIQAVIQACGFPLAAPSANPSNGISPTTARHVFQSLGGRIPLVVDGGPSHVGIESTVLDLHSASPRLLRPGMIHADAVRAVMTGDEASSLIEAGHTSCPPSTLRSPGMLKRHYAPKARLLVLRWLNEEELKAQIFAFLAQGFDPGPPNGGNCFVDPANLASQEQFPVGSLGACHVISHTNIPSKRDFGRVTVVPREPEAFARALYAELHESDAAGASIIVVEAPPEGEPWRAISDRLTRGSAV